MLPQQCVEVAHLSAASVARLFLALWRSPSSVAATWLLAPVLRESSLPVRLKKSPSFCTLHSDTLLSYMPFHTLWDAHALRTCLMLSAAQYTISGTDIQGIMHVKRCGLSTYLSTVNSTSEPSSIMCPGCLWLAQLLACSQYVQCECRPIATQLLYGQAGRCKETALLHPKHFQRTTDIACKAAVMAQETLTCPS